LVQFLSQKCRAGIFPNHAEPKVFSIDQSISTHTFDPPTRRAKSLKNKEKLNGNDISYSFHSDLIYERGEKEGDIYLFSCVV
jgi:hypothetical protein